MFKVTTTMDGNIETFDTKEEAMEFVKKEISWWNSPSENKNDTGYHLDDFIIEEIKREN